MPNIGALLKQEIARLSRREIRGQVQATKKASAQYRRHIAALRRQIGTLERQVASLQRRVGNGAEAPASEVTPKTRFVAKGLKSQRARLGLSAGEYARLVGVSPQSIYNWEHGHTSPRAAQIAIIAQLRGVGKREAQSRLEQLEAKRAPRANKPAARRGRSRN